MEAAKATEGKLLNLKIEMKQGVLRIEMEKSFCRELLVMEGGEKEGFPKGAAAKGQMRFKTTKKDKA